MPQTIDGTVLVGQHCEERFDAAQSSTVGLASAAASLSGISGESR